MATAKDMNKFVKVVVSSEGKHLLQMPDGSMIPGIVFTRVHDDCDGDTHVIVKLLATIEVK